MPDAPVPSLAPAHARIAAVRPADYARTRNFLNGAVSGLSPCITLGFITVLKVLAGGALHNRMDVQHKFVLEVGWREYFRSRNCEGSRRLADPPVDPGRAAARAAGVHHGGRRLRRRFPPRLAMERAPRALHRHLRLAPWLTRWANCQAVPSLFPRVDPRCDSFSQWWTRVSRGLHSVGDLLAATEALAC